MTKKNDYNQGKNLARKKRNPDEKAIRKVLADIVHDDIVRRRNIFHTSSGGYFPDVLFFDDSDEWRMRLICERIGIIFSHHFYLFGMLVQRIPPWSDRKSMQIDLLKSSVSDLFYPNISPCYCGKIPAVFKRDKDSDYAVWCQCGWKTKSASTSKEAVEDWEARKRDRVEDVRRRYVSVEEHKKEHYGDH